MMPVINADLATDEHRLARIEPLEKGAGGLVAAEGAEGKNLGDVVAESIGCMRAGGVAFIDFGGARSP